MTARDDATARGGARGDDDAARFTYAGAQRLKCAECGRVFDLLDKDDAEEWTYGHDCETTGDTQ